MGELPVDGSNSTDSVEEGKNEAQVIHFLMAIKKHATYVLFAIC